MDKQEVSANSLAARCKQLGHDIGQTTISAILRGKQGASLKNIEIISEGLGVPTWYLFMNADAVEQRVIRPPTVAARQMSRIPDYPKIFQPKTVKKTRAKSR